MEDKKEQYETENRLIEGLKNFIKEQIEKDDFSGAVLIAKNGSPIFEFTAGFARKEQGIKNSPEIIFNIGSMNKMFTGVAMSQLVEKGKVYFEDRVGRFLPEYPNSDVRENVTIHHLLTHTSGLGHFLQNKERFLTSREKIKSIKDFVDFFKNDSFNREIGKYQYSGNGYELLGRIIEAVTGKSYYEFVKENIFDVAFMRDTDSYTLEQVVQNPRIALGYTRRGDDGESKNEGARRSNEFMLLVKGGAGGGGFSTASDLLHFANALTGNNLLSVEMTRKVLSPKELVGVKEKEDYREELYYGYGFQILKHIKTDGTTFLRYGHAGVYAGANARLDMYPDFGITVVVLQNIDEPAAFRVANKAGELIFT